MSLRSLACFLLALAAAPLLADTTTFTITDDAALNASVAAARSAFISYRSQQDTALSTLNVCVLLPNGDGTWKRGSYNPTTIIYPASCVKLAYLASSMYWCRTNGHPYDFLESCVGPMIRVSDNVQTGVVVDTITGQPNISDVTSTADSRFLPWYNKREYTENFLATHGLVENQVLCNKTYPTNSGSGPAGAEAVSINTYRGGNRMQPKCAASLMLEIQKGAIEPDALPYMQGLLTHDRWGSQTVLGQGVPPGSVMYNKYGNAYNNLNDIMYVKLPNNREMIVAVFSDAFSGVETSNPSPYNVSSLGLFMEMLIEQLGLNTGNPPTVKVDNTSAVFAGSWTTGSSTPDRYQADYRSAPGSAANTATWNLNVPKAGKYEVCVWYPQGANRATDVPFTVNYSGGSQTIKVNQQNKGGRWVRLGDFQFEAGGGSVVLTGAVSDSTKLVLADGVKATMWPTTETGAKDWQRY